MPPREAITGIPGVGSIPHVTQYKSVSDCLDSLFATGRPDGQLTKHPPSTEF